MAFELLKELFFHFTLSKEVTTILEYDSKELKNTVQKLYPFNEEDKVASDYPIVPLITIGEIHGNANFCRVSANEKDPSILYVHFRPLNIEGVDEIIKKAKVLETISKYVRFKKLSLKQEYLIHLTRLIDGKTITPLGVLESYEKELSRPEFTIYLNNSLEAMASKQRTTRKYGFHVQRLLNQDKMILCEDALTPLNHTSLGKAIKHNVSILETLVSFIQSYQPSHVYFAGYSLGSAMAMASSYLIHNRLSIKPMMSVYQFAGPKVGTVQMNDYVRKHFKDCYYISVSKDDYLDLVSRLQKPPLQHIGTIYNIDLTKHTIQRMINDGLYGKYKMSMTSLIIGFILKRKNAEPFQTIHNAAENVIGRVLLKHLIEHDYSLKPYITDGPICEYFSEGYSGKYNICPNLECYMTREQRGKKQWNVCKELDIVTIPPPMITLPKQTKTAPLRSIPKIVLPPLDRTKLV
jgi:hypothetical protein